MQAPEHLVDVINKQVNDLKRFIIEKTCLHMIPPRP